MKALKIVGGSVSLLYLVCVLIAVSAFGVSPAGIIPAAHAGVSAEAGQVAQPAVVAKEVKAEPAQEQSVISSTADAIPDWAEILSSVIALAAAVAAVTPSPKDNKVLGVARKVLDIFALNVFGAKNASAVKDKSRVSW